MLAKERIWVSTQLFKNHSTSLKDTNIIINSARARKDQTAPNVTITSPVTGTSVSGNVTIETNATDNIGVTSVTIFVNGLQSAFLSSALYNQSPTLVLAFNIPSILNPSVRWSHRGCNHLAFCLERTMKKAGKKKWLENF